MDSANHVRTNNENKVVHRDMCTVCVDECDDPRPCSTHSDYDSSLARRCRSFVYGWVCRANTIWIMVCLVAGVCLGHDFPAIGVHGRLPSMIFIRLVKCIIAPLLFAMLVRGIAQQSDIKRTGRLALKAIIYFEVVSTIALVLGLVAINVSKAGVG